MNAKDDQIYIAHILECIADVERYTKNNRQSFMENDIVRNACLRQLQIMSESCTRLSPSLRATIATIDWAQISGFRNILVHDYTGNINFDIVWGVIERRLPQLKIALSGAKI